eukprot:scaffold79094_cov35-Cyclotella_meneghiniana.AAC.1
MDLLAALAALGRSLLKVGSGRVLPPYLSISMVRFSIPNWDPPAEIIPNRDDLKFIARTSEIVLPMACVSFWGVGLVVIGVRLAMAVTHHCIRFNSGRDSSWKQTKKEVDYIHGKFGMSNEGI